MKDRGKYQGQKDKDNYTHGWNLDALRIECHKHKIEIQGMNGKKRK